MAVVKGSSAFFLKSIKLFANYKGLVRFFTRSSLRGKALELSKLYQLYKAFHTQPRSRKLCYFSRYAKALKKSIDRINNKVTEPTKVSKPKTTERKSKISKNSLRGDSRFVQLAKLNLNDYAKPVFENEYAYQPPLDDTTEYDKFDGVLKYYSRTWID